MQHADSADSWLPGPRSTGPASRRNLGRDRSSACWRSCPTPAVHTIRNEPYSLQPICPWPTRELLAVSTRNERSIGAPYKGVGVPIIGTSRSTIIIILKNNRTIKTIPPGMTCNLSASVRASQVYGRFMEGLGCSHRQLCERDRILACGRSDRPPGGDLSQENRKRGRLSRRGLIISSAPRARRGAHLRPGLPLQVPGGVAVGGVRPAPPPPLCISLRLQ